LFLFTHPFDEIGYYPEKKIEKYEAGKVNLLPAFYMLKVG
jgi:hypothetical protein